MHQGHPSPRLRRATWPIAVASRTRKAFPFGTPLHTTPVFLLLTHLLSFLTSLSFHPRKKRALLCVTSLPIRYSARETSRSIPGRALRCNAAPFLERFLDPEAPLLARGCSERRRGLDVARLLHRRVPIGAHDQVIQEFDTEQLSCLLEPSG